MYNDKRKLSPRLPMMNAWGCLFGLVMLAFGLLAGGTAGLFGLPYLLNYDVTQTVAWVKIHLKETEQSDQLASMAETAVAANETAIAAMSLGTQSALSFAATQNALFNADQLLNQTATQSALYGQGTATARADQFNQSLTQIALDQQATQVSLQQEATNVQLNFQATQAAIQGRGQSLTVTPQPRTQAQSVPLISAASATPTAPAASAALVDSHFGDGIDSSAWLPSRESDWTQETGGVRASVDGAVMASRQDFGAPLEMDVVFTPALNVDSDYHILFGRDGQAGYEIILNAEVLNARQITLAQANGELIVSNSAQGTLTGETHLTVTMAADQVTVSLNGETILTAQLPAAPQGNLAVSLPKGAFLKAIQVREG